MKVQTCSLCGWVHIGPCPTIAEPAAEPEWDEETLYARFELYGALWLVCSRWHSGMESRGYRILSRLSRAGYSPGIGLQDGRFESESQEELFHELRARYAHVL